MRILISVTSHNPFNHDYMKYPDIYSVSLIRGIKNPADSNYPQGHGQKNIYVKETVPKKPELSDRRFGNDKITGFGAARVGGHLTNIVITSMGYPLKRPL
jgi:hypothetical protein